MDPYTETIQWENKLRPHFHPENADKLEIMLKEVLVIPYIIQILNHIERLVNEGNDGLIRDIILYDDKLSVFTIGKDGRPRWVSLPGLPRNEKNVY